MFVDAHLFVMVSISVQVENPVMKLPVHLTQRKGNKAPWCPRLQAHLYQRQCPCVENPFCLLGEFNIYNQ